MKSEYVPCVQLVISGLLKSQMYRGIPLNEYLKSLLLDEAIRYLINEFGMKQDVAYEYCISLQNGLLD